MKEVRCKSKNLIKIHFGLLIFILLHFMLELGTGFRFKPFIFYGFKIGLYLTGIFLFFKSIRPFRWVIIYYFFYALTGFVSLLMFTIGGMFLAIMATFLFFPVYPVERVYSGKNVTVYTQYRGFFGPCCYYEVVRPAGYLFEEYIGAVKTDKPVRNTSVRFEWLSKDTLIYVNSTDTLLLPVSQE